MYHPDPLSVKTSIEDNNDEHKELITEQNEKFSATGLENQQFIVITYKGNDLKCLIDTGFTVNMITHNDKEYLIHTSNGPLRVNRYVTLQPNNLFPMQHTFLIHPFSTNFQLIMIF